ncbi:MAG: citrate lyase acyl carrier protein [Fusobacterium sp.]
MIGICGNEKNSDALVTVDLNCNGIEVEVESKLKKMFGKLMEKAVREVLEEEKVENAKVKVQDFGALDFVIKGRTRTALHRAQKGDDK